MSATVALQPMTITAGACAFGVPPQPTILSNVSFATVNSPPPAQTTLSNASVLSTVTTTATLTFTQTAAVGTEQLLLLAQSVGPACSSISTYAWPATFQQVVVELPTAPATAAATPSAAAHTVTVLPATVPASSASSAAAAAAPDDDGSYGNGRLGPYQSAGVGVGCTVVFLAVVYLLFLLWRRRRRQRRVRDDGGEVAELPADCECSKPKVAAELPAIELVQDPVELPAFETWTSGGTLSELSELSLGEDDLSERAKSSSPLGDWLPTPV
jgi:hypothetical protein